MELGLFTLLLKVKNLKVSRSFYEKFGFFASTPEPSNKNWIVRKNGKTVIDLFQDMLEKNTLILIQIDDLNNQYQTLQIFENYIII